MGRPELDAAIRRLRAEVEESPAYGRIRGRGDYALRVFWREGEFIARFQRTLGTTHRGGEATVRVVDLVRGPGGCLIRAVTTHDVFRGRSHVETDVVEMGAPTVAEAVERIAVMMEGERPSG